MSFKKLILLEKYYKITPKILNKNKPQIALEIFNSLTSSEYILITFSIVDDVKEIKTHTKVNEG